MEKYGVVKGEQEDPEDSPKTLKDLKDRQSKLDRARTRKGGARGTSRPGTHPSGKK